MKNGCWVKMISSTLIKSVVLSDVLMVILEIKMYDEVENNSFSVLLKNTKENQIRILEILKRSSQFLISQVFS